MPPPPFVTCAMTTESCFADAIDVRSGPPLPPWPVEPWQVEQFDAKIDLPAAALPAAFVLFLFCVAPACSTPWPAPGAAAGPSLPSREKTQRLSPCGVAASALPPA